MAIVSSGDERHRDPLVTTKLYIPPARPNLVPRPRLTERLDETMRRKLTLISAPAGFGKTTLLSEWIRAKAQGARVAWVSLDDGDNDPARFISYLIAALQSFKSAHGDNAPARLLTSKTSPLQAALTVLINDLDAVPHDLILVLDDYHVIRARSIHDAIAFLLDHLPPQMHLVMATRADPPLPVGRLRARDQLTELRAADLRFTPEEAAVFLNRAMGASLSAEDIATLEERTEGWITGLYLAALSIQGCQDVPGFIRSFAGSHRFILDYLAEVLQRQPSSAQDFMLQTGILDHLTSPLCDAVTGRGDSQAMLESLEQSNLFIVPLDHERRWYRYHQLFAEFLCSRLRQTQPDRVHELHRRASQWYGQNGFAIEAVNHALAAKDYDQSARLIEENAQDVLMRSEVKTLLGWLDALPEELVHSRPRLSLSHAWALLLTSQYDAAEAHLVFAEREPQDESEARSSATHAWLAESAAIRALVAALREDVPQITELCRQTLEYVPQDNLFLRSMSYWNLGVAYCFKGDMTGASRMLGQALDASQAGRNIFVAILSIYVLGYLEMISSHLHQAAEIYQQGMRIAAGEDGQPLPVAGLAYIGMGDVLRERNDLTAATTCLVKGIELGKRWGSPDMIVDGYAILARVKYAQGDLDGALAMLLEFEEIMRERQVIPWDVAQMAAIRTRLWLAKGQLGTAAHWAEECQARIERDGLDTVNLLPHGIEYSTLARVWIAQGKLSQTIDLLERLLDGAQASGRMGDAIELLALRAIALQAQGETKQALSELARALSLAEPEGYVRVFVDEGAPMQFLISALRSDFKGEMEKRARGARAETLQRLWAFSGKLLAAFPANSTLAAPESGRMVELFNERERQVLRLIADGMSNQEIADKLVLAVSTVKWHINKLYGKLDVKTRTQAIARAKEQRLL